MNLRFDYQIELMERLERKYEYDRGWQAAKDAACGIWDAGSPLRVANLYIDASQEEDAKLFADAYWKHNRAKVRARSYKTEWSET